MAKIKAAVSCPHCGVVNNVEVSDNCTQSVTCKLGCRKTFRVEVSQGSVKRVHK